MEKDKEIDFLNTISVNYYPHSKYDYILRSLIFRTIKPYVQPNKSILEFGCDDGSMTSMISDIAGDVTVVDGSEVFVNELKSKGLLNVTCIHSLFEDFKSDKKFDYIFASYILEHVSDPQNCLSIIKNLLTDDGLLFVVVPNARSLSRQIARHMGVIDDLYALTASDVSHGHRRVYDFYTINKDLKEVGLKVVSSSGLLLKIMSDAKMDAAISTGIIDSLQIEGLYLTGLEYPELSSSILMVCSK